MKKSIISKKIGFQIIILLLLIVFFTKICPVIPFDGDDWYFTGSIRLPIPLWKAFNPVKVLPEVLEPIGGLVAAYLVYPLTNDYVGSIAFTQAVLISLSILTLFYSFYKFVILKFNKTEEQGVMYEGIFAISFFLIFKRLEGISSYAFWVPDLNCYFNYIIPGILNACIVLIIASYDNFAKEFENWNYIKKGFLIVTSYFAIFSSIQLSIILSVYCSWELLKNIIGILKNEKKYRINKIIKKSKIYIIELIVWFVSLIFEMNGFRASIISNEDWLSLRNIKEVAKNFLSLYKQFNIVLMSISVICIVITLIYTIKYIKNKNDKGKKLLKVLCANIYLCVITFVYLFLVYMKAGAGYASSPNGTWALIFYIIAFINIYIILACDLIPKIKIGLPFAIVIMITITCSMTYKFAQSVFDYSKAKQIDEFIINQIVQADNEGKKYVKVKVPKYNDESNWPIPYNMAVWLQNGLYSHNIIKNRIKIEFEPDMEVYKKYYSYYEGEYQNYYDFERGIYLKTKE